MSFSQQVKKEVAAQQWPADCCTSAACYGIACFAKYFDARGVVLHTEQAYIANWALALYEKAGVRGAITQRGGRSVSYEFAVKDPFEAEKVLALFSHSEGETALHIRPENLVCNRCFSAFTAAAFLCGGVVVNPEKGYLLEFVSPRYTMMRDFEAILAQRGFVPKYAQRKGYNVLYYKASEQIEDLLTTMGASRSALEIMNLKVYKDFRNRANRITNCETANINKIVAANRRVLEAIQFLAEKGALDSLPLPLQQAAALRMNNPDLSLADLAQLSNEPVSKSGLSHRYHKLTSLAERLAGQMKEQKVEHKPLAPASKP